MGNKVCRNGRDLGRQLFVFDFDQTIVLRNCEQLYKELVAKHRNVSVIDKELTREINWENICQELIDYTLTQGVQVSAILQAVRELEFVPGMDKFLQKVVKLVKRHPESQFVILSAANDLYIETKLNTAKPPIKPTAIVANHAFVTADLTRIQYEFHDDNVDCKVCRNALCKGRALEEYIRTHGPFDRIHYFGDGLNDVCAAVRLRSNDCLYIRYGLGLHDIITHGLPVTHDLVRISAKVKYWNTGFELIEQTKDFF